MALSLVLAACSSGGGLGDIFGGGSNNASGELRGRVDYVDTASNYVVLTNVSGAGSMLSSSGGNTVRVYYDSNTPVEWQGRTYHPSDLERGDEVAVRVDQSGNNLYAQSMTVLYNSSGSGPSSGGVSGDTTVRGTVRYVDTSRRIIEVDRFGGGLVTLSYDSNTYVTFDNRNYRVEDLERGDEIEIRTSDLGSGRLAARDILVTRSVSSGNTGGTFGNDFATVRGTVRYVDQSRREIGIESTSWIRRFNSGAGTGSTMVLRYDANTQVEYNGRLYAPTNLEPGDLIEVEVANSGSSSYLANRIVVVRDVNVR
jgi:hypothetical protein